MKNALVIICATIVIVAIIIVGAFSGLFGKWFENKLDYAGKKIDEKTRYETMKKVEDSARAMVASFEADRLTYEQYKDSGDKEKQSWAEQAKMRANKTAASYNNYILKNSYVWDGNVPDDINTELPYLE